ncbi:PREDICTED: protein FAR1-RELATED SEQUENCE 5-like [Fragaria vesca subsp. vesca]
MAGGIQNVGCMPRDLRNFERDLREEVRGHDATMLLEYFESEKEKKPSFYFEVDRDEENRMTRCFWADPTSKKAYFFFNDVVVFDTTYNTNKYRMIFAPITGVNHHGQTIVFGCGLLSDEKTESFIWLLEQWLKAMPSGPPKVIITDQYQAIAKAIAQVLPHTLHRFCIWHIMFKFRDKLGPVIAQGYYGLFKNSVYNSKTKEEFEASWKNAVQQSKQENHVWLTTMYELRSRWIPAFCNHIFHAGMQSSQRVESNHSFFKTFVSLNNSLLDFATRIKRGLGQQRHEELIRDHIDSNEIPKTKTYYPIEKQMREVYTKEIFLRFQDQVVKSTAYLKCETLKEDEHDCVYTVLRAADDEQSWKRVWQREKDRAAEDEGKGFVEDLKVMIGKGSVPNAKAMREVLKADVWDLLHCLRLASDHGYRAVEVEPDTSSVSQTQLEEMDSVYSLVYSTLQE